jgi:hypothetical protein
MKLQGRDAGKNTFQIEEKRLETFRPEGLIGCAYSLNALTIYPDK